jgi:hypothetical protein
MIEKQYIVQRKKYILKKWFFKEYSFDDKEEAIIMAKKQEKNKNVKDVRIFEVTTDKKEIYLELE